jgi:hypothetical protein
MALAETRAHEQEIQVARVERGDRDVGGEADYRRRKRSHTQSLDRVTVRCHLEF